jgi:hypothetical protein
MSFDVSICIAFAERITRYRALKDLGGFRSPGKKSPAVI